MQPNSKEKGRDMEGINCRKCAKVNPPEATFCMHCGTKLVSGNTIVIPFTVLGVSEQADLTKLLSTLKEALAISPYDKGRSFADLIPPEVRTALFSRSYGRGRTQYRIEQGRQALIRYFGLDGQERRSYEAIRDEAGIKSVAIARQWVRLGVSALIFELRRNRSNYLR